MVLASWSIPILISTTVNVKPISNIALVVMNMEMVFSMTGSGLRLRNMALDLFIDFPNTSTCVTWRTIKRMGHGLTTRKSFFYIKALYYYNKESFIKYLLLLFFVLK